MPPFQYPEYRSPLAGSIAAIMMRRGEIQASGAERLGDIQARGIEQRGAALGQSIGLAGGQIAGAMQAENDPQRQLARVTFEQTKRAAAYQQTASKIASSLVGPNGEVPDPDAIQKALIAAQIPATFHDAILKPFESMQRNHKEAMADAGAVAFRVIGSLPANASDDDRNHAASAALGVATASKLIGAEEAQQLTAALAKGADPRGLALGFMGASPSGRYKDVIQDESKPITLPATPRGGAPARVITPGGRVIGQGDAAPAQPPTAAELALRAAGGDAARAVDLMHPKPAKALQRAQVLLDGKPRELLIDPDPMAKQKAFDLDGKPIENASVRVAPIPTSSSVAAGSALSDVKEAVQGMKDGTLPPQLPGRASKEYTATLAEAHRQGYDLRGAVLDYQAVQQHVKTLNGSKFTALLSSIQTAGDSLDVIQKLADKWDGGRFPILNRANLMLAKGGAYGKDAASIANQLEGQITDVVSELGNVYMGGNSPTDHALKLAEKNLSADWDRKVLTDMIALARTNLQIRGNSIRHSEPVLASPAAPAAGVRGASAAPKEGDQQSIPGVPGGVAELRGGKWIRIK